MTLEQIQAEIKYLEKMWNDTLAFRDFDMAESCLIELEALRYRLGEMKNETDGYF